MMAANPQKCHRSLQHQHNPQFWPMHLPLASSGGMVGNEKLRLLHIFNGTLLKVVARHVKSRFEVNMPR